MKEITIKQEFTIELPKEYENLSAEEVMSKLESMYDIHGSDITIVSNADYVGTTVTEMDGTPVFCKDSQFGQMISNTGMDCLLDGQPHAWNTGKGE